MKKPLSFPDKAYLRQCQNRKTYLNHIHWDGSIPAEFLFQFYQKQGKPLLLPEKDVSGNLIAYKSERERVIDTAEKLRQFQQGLLTKYGIVDVFAVPIGAMQTKEDIIAMAVAHCHYLQEQNTFGTESTFAPQYHCEKGLSLSQIIGYAVEGFAQGKEETGISVKPIIAIGREASPELGEAVVRAALEFVGKIAGVGLVCFEPGNPPEKHYHAFKLTFDSDLNRTIHAGEMCSEKENLENIYTSLTLLKANGIAHAIPLHKRMYKHHDLVELMIRNNVRLEVNPISNYNFFINDIADLHLDKLMCDEVMVTINPDDPAMWPNGDMAHNLYVVGKLYGEEFVDKVIENSIKTAWGLKPAD